MLVRIGSYDICDGTNTGGVAVGQFRWQVDRVVDVVTPVRQVNPVLFSKTTWKPSAVYYSGNTIIDPAGHVQLSNDGVSGVTIPTFDDSGGTTSDGTITWTDQGIVGKGILTFTVQVTHATQNAAELFVLELDDNLPSTGIVSFEMSDGVSFQDFEDGNVLSHESVLNGATSTTQYSIAVASEPST